MSASHAQPLNVNITVHAASKSGLGVARFLL
jgi:hypothetical protein